MGTLRARLVARKAFPALAAATRAPASVQRADVSRAVRGGVGDPRQATSKWDIPLVESLCENGADPNGLDYDGR